MTDKRLQSLIVTGLMFYPFALIGFFIAAPARNTDLMVALVLVTLVATWWAAAKIHEHWCDKPATPDATQPELPF